MAETLININQNQLNNQTGSYVELIKNTQQAKENLTTALVNKGAGVSSSSTFTDLINATKDLATFESFTPVFGNSVAWNYASNAYTNAATFDSNSHKRMTIKGLFSFKLTGTSSLQIRNLTGDYYDSTSTSSAYTYTLPYASSYVSTTTYGYSSQMYVNSDGSKLWYLGSDGISIYECSIDYSGVSIENPTNVSLSVIKTITLSSAYSNAGISIVNETAKKILLYNGGTGGNSITLTNFLYIVDYSESETGLTPTLVSGISLTSMRQCCPLGLPESLFCCQGYTTSLPSFIHIDWSTNTLTSSNFVYPFNNNTAAYNPLSVFTLTINNVTRPILPYISVYYDEGIQKTTLHLVFLDDFTKKTFTYNSYALTIGLYQVSTQNTYSVLYTSFNRASLPQLDITNNELYVTGCPIGSYFKISVIDNDITALYTPALCLYSYYNSLDANVIPALISFKNNRVFSENITTMNRTLYTDKIIAYVYTTNNGDQAAFINWYTGKLSDGTLDKPTIEVLVEDN